MLEICLFGPGSVRLDGHELAGFPKHQSFILFAYLLLNRKARYRREPLAAVFWGDSFTVTSRKALRNTLWRLRQVFTAAGFSAEDYFTMGDEYISFSPRRPYWLDVETFEAAIEGCRDIEGQDLRAEQAAGLEEATMIYTGDLLEGLYGDWCLQDRERLRLLYMRALSKLMVYNGVHSLYEQGLACGERILALDHGREKVHRCLMWLHLMSGNRVAAMAQYKRCTQILNEELGIAPMARTQQLYEQIVHDTFNPLAWPIYADSPAVLDKGANETTGQLMADAAQTLHHLQNIIDEANSELQRLEKIIDLASPTHRDS